MCLITNQVKPYIAEEDLTVYKVLKRDRGRLLTLYTDTKVSTNNVLYAEGREDITLRDFNERHIGGGYIHSFMKIPEYYNRYGIVAYEAIIPKGTEYFIDNGLWSVCSKKLFITDKLVNIPNDLPSSEQKKVLKSVIDRIDKEKVCTGWLYLSDGTFCHPDESLSSAKTPSVFGIDFFIMGIVVGNTEDSIIILYPEMYEYAFGLDRIVPFTVNEYGIEWSLPTRELLEKIIPKDIDVLNYTLSKWFADSEIRDANILCRYGEGGYEKIPISYGEITGRLFLPFRVYRFAKIPKQ